MSYMRIGHEMTYFKGSSNSYVYCCFGVSDEYYHVEDYEDDYKDNVSFAELLTQIVYRETRDEKYAWKIAKTLAKKLKIQKHLKEEPITFEEYINRYNEIKQNKVKKNWKVKKK